MRFGLREIIFVTLMLGLMASVYFFGFAKADARKRALDQETEQRVKALANLRQCTAGVGDLEKKIAELGQAIAFFESKLPQEKEIDKILKEVWQMAEANSLTTRTIKTLKSERSSNYSEQPIQLSLSGDFNGFYSFLLQLEKLPRITRVSEMNLTKIDGRDGEMQARMTMSIFFEPDAGRTPAAAGALGRAD